MAWYLVRLKVALLRNALKVGWRRRVGLIVAAFVWFFIVVTAAGLGMAHDAQVTVPLIFDSFFVGWLLMPLLGLGTDETLDPSRLALLPLRRRTLMTGLLAATLVGLAPVATFLALSAPLLRSTGAASVLVGAVAVLAELLLCVVGSRALTTLFSGILRSRRGRDLLVFVIAIVAVLPALASQVIPRLAVQAGPHGLSVTASRSLFWLPSGWAARALLQARGAQRGADLSAAWHLAAVLAVVAVLFWVWSAALQRALTTAESGPGKSARKAGDLFARPLGWLPRTRVGAVAAKELRYTWRDPRRRAALFTVFLLIGLPAAGLGQHAPSPSLVLIAASGALVFGLQALNQFGTDGAAFWMNVASGRDPAVDFKGKNLASAILGLAVVTAGALVIAPLVHGWVYVPGAILLGGAVVGVTLAVANQVSVLSPFPLPDAVTNLWAGPGCLTALSGVAALFVAGAFLLPVIVGTGVSLVLWRPGLPLACALSAMYGFVLWRVGLAMATRRMRLRELDCLAIVSGERGA